MNLFAYCGNNPVSRFDPTGEAWWHWALGAAIVTGCAIATVITCGGFTAAITSVCLVANGIATGSIASTIATAAFVGSAIVYGMAVLSAEGNSSSVEEFNNQGNWGTVVTTLLGGICGGCNGYIMSEMQNDTSVSSLSQDNPLHTSGYGSPDNNVNPGGSYTKFDSKGRIYSYTQYDSKGR